MTYDDLCAALRSWLDISPNAPPIPLSKPAPMFAKRVRYLGGGSPSDSIMIMLAEYIDENRPKEYRRPALDQLILSYMSTRCDVSSQHKLPSIEELRQSCSIGSFYNALQIEQMIDDMVGDGRLYRYGPYLSDRPIAVL